MPEEASYALQRVCEELEHVVWPIDRAISAENPKRKYWIRPTHPIEISERELTDGKAMRMPPPETRYYTVVYEPIRGCRFRLLFLAEDIADTCRSFPEARCKDIYGRCCHPDFIGLGEHLAAKLAHHKGVRK